MRVIYTWGLLLALLQLGTSLLIGAFNIQCFGKTKSEKPDVMKHIINIVHRYDVILIQEVRDSECTAIDALMAEVNIEVPGQYSHTVSDPLGPSTYKERYLFIYRKTVTLLQNYQLLGVFNRPPFVVKFSSEGGDFVLVPLHTPPSSALEELKALYDVVTDVRTRFGNNILLLGDFNAACSYATTAELDTIPLRTNRADFHWLIPDTVDTTVSRSGCAYDRIVATTEMNNRVVPGSAAVFDFQSEYGLSKDQALAVSDHFPVEVSLNDVPPR
ncbi:unnamed protein product [Lota lota]